MIPLIVLFVGCSFEHPRTPEGAKNILAVHTSDLLVGLSVVNVCRDNPEVLALSEDPIKLSAMSNTAGVVAISRIWVE